MNREVKNEMVRGGLIDAFASTKLARALLEKRARLFSGVAQTPLDDFIHALRAAGIDLTAAVPDERSAALFVQTEVAAAVLLSIALLKVPQRKLVNDGDELKRAEIARAVKAHRDAQGLARRVKEPGFTIEDFHAELVKFDSPEIAKRMLLSPQASGKVVTLDNHVLDPIKLPLKRLNSKTSHRLRIAVVEVPSIGTQATVKITRAANPTSVAVSDLFKRNVLLEYRRFEGVQNISDLLLSLRLAKREADVLVTIARALRTGDKDLDLLVLKEFYGLKELAAAVPDEVRRIQEDLWGCLR